MSCDALVYRVATRFLKANLQHELTHRFDSLLQHAPDNPPPEEVAEFRKWIADNFRLSGRVPKEGKMAQSELNRFWRALEPASKRFGLEAGAFHFMTSLWGQIQREVPAMIQYLTTEGTLKAVPVFEKKVGGNTYVNMVGASEERFNEMISAIEGVFSTLKGWRAAALSGGITVNFAGPKDFRGTASGHYSRDGDVLWIRATPGGRIEKGGSGYGGLAYVITHELGHRYEAKHHVPVDFDKTQWLTSPYSRKDGEGFAELFALSNFGITHYKPEVVEKFDAAMGH